MRNLRENSSWLLDPCQVGPNISTKHLFATTTIQVSTKYIVFIVFYDLI
jgi:hypothetical protein